MVLTVVGKFGLDEAFNPPPLKPIVPGDADGSVVEVGRGIVLRVPNHLGPVERLLDARVEIDPRRFSGLGDVVAGCAIVCRSNHCTQAAVRLRRARAVAKVIGVDSEGPNYVVLAQPKLVGAARVRRESRIQRVEAGFVPHVLVEPYELQCAHCMNRGTIAA